MKRTVFIGWDPREAAAFAVARRSMLRHASGLDVRGLILSDLEASGLHRRPLVRDIGHLYDTLSARKGYNGAIATEHANARFLAPWLAAQAVGRAGALPATDRTERGAQLNVGWVLFVDGDILLRADIRGLFDGLDPDKAVYVVQHEHRPPAGLKMDGQAQTAYARKNWSSVMALNTHHPANRKLTLELVNTAPGRDLHAFCWLKARDIGALEPRWNFLVGHSDPAIVPALVHFTEGVPDMPGYENVPYAAEWRAERDAWARGTA